MWKKKWPQINLYQQAWTNNPSLWTFYVFSASFTMKPLILAGEKFGYQVEEHINYLDKSKSSPLHLAVRGGNIDAIGYCIATGARVDQRQVKQTQKNL